MNITKEIQKKLVDPKCDQIEEILAYNQFYLQISNLRILKYRLHYFVIPQVLELTHYYLVKTKMPQYFFCDI
ncbi:hypothetical protein B8T70_10990 [Flavobacterium sp. AJR]|nr:hypothetical protein B8T70_10990 [Flavobacterium sp. AJR]